MDGRIKFDALIWICRSIVFSGLVFNSVNEFLENRGLLILNFKSNTEYIKLLLVCRCVNNKSRVSSKQNSFPLEGLLRVSERGSKGIVT